MAEPQAIAGVEMAKVKTISTVDVPQVWIVEYEVDFATESDHEFGPWTEGDEVTLNGVKWSASSGSRPTKFEIENGVGLEIDPKPSTSDNWYAGARKAPVLSALVSDMVSGIKDGDTLAFQLVMTGSTLDGNYQACGLGVFDGSGEISGSVSSATNADGFVCARNFYEGARSIGSIRNNSQDKLATNQGDFYEIIWYPNVSFYIAMSTIGSNPFRDPGKLYTYQGYLAMEKNFGSELGSIAFPNWDIHRPDHADLQARVGIFAQGQTTSNQLTTSATRFRVLRKGT